MTAALPIKHKPFNLEHAKAGAPICNRQGDKAYFVAHVPEAIAQSRVVVRDAGGGIGTRHENGKHYTGGEQVPGDLVMTPLGYVDGEPVFTGDELLFDPVDSPPSIHKVLPQERQFPMCSWPAPAKVYPTFTGSLDTLAIAFNGRKEFAVGLVAVANAAFAHAVDAGQVLTAQDHMDAIATIQAKLYRAERALTRAGFVDHGAEEWKPPVGEKPAYIRDAERDMVIAKAVLDAVSVPFGEMLRYDGLPAIIAKVPA